MVGIVIVSHSEKLAAGVAELARQMAPSAVPIALAAGIDDPDNPLGTDAARVTAAIESLGNDDAVIVLVDVGGAIRSAEMSLELLPERLRRRVRLCDAPLVEGAIAAAATAATGADIDRVLAEARAAGRAKLGDSTAAPAAGSGGGACDASMRLVVDHEHGIHVRPAAQIVATASGFRSEVSVRDLTNGRPPASAKSIHELMVLGVGQGHEIEIAARGPDARQALAELADLVRSGFETLAPVASPRPVEAKGQITRRAEAEATCAARIAATAASPGIGLGPVTHLERTMPTVIEEPAGKPGAEADRLDRAVRAVVRELKQLVESLRQADASAGAADILVAHQVLLEDPALRRRVDEAIAGGRRSAASAWKAAIDRIVAAYQILEDPYLRARAADVQDVGLRVLQRLAGFADVGAICKPGVLVAADLRPSEAARLDPEVVAGICTAAGSPTGHSTIIARMLGIPMVVGAGQAVLDLPEGVLLAFDGQTGDLWIRPNDATVASLDERRGAQRRAAACRIDALGKPATTRDGHRVRLLANVPNLTGARQAIALGAEGVGVLRTEVLFLDRATPPDEREQYETYRAIAEVMGERPVIVRTLDAGGDKPVGFLRPKAEANPQLGWRGIRQSLASPELFVPQLRAILRAGHEHPVSVLLPMVATVRELCQARQIIDRARAELLGEGLPVAERTEVGIMIEVPAAVALADDLAARADFFSIGTNDLSQYVMAADRTNPAVAELADPLEPAVLRMIDQTVRAGRAKGIRVCVCGEVASDPAAVPILVGLGIDELSMNASSIPAVKEALARCRRDEARTIARRATRLDSARAVRDLVREKTLGG
jgi:phosphocarrier protein FPr